MGKEGTGGGHVNRMEEDGDWKTPDPFLCPGAQPTESVIYSFDQKELCLLELALLAEA